MSKQEKEDFMKVEEALKNNCPDDEIRNLIEMASFNSESDVDEDGHNIVFYFEEYGRSDLWEQIFSDWESDAYAAAMDDYDMALKPYCN